MRQWLVSLHRWFGLGASVWLLGICLSGSIIAFDDQLDRALNPDLFQASGEGPVARAIETVQLTYPDRSIRFVLLDWTVPGLVRFGLRDQEGQSHEIFVDSGRNKILGGREQGLTSLSPRHAVATMYRLHTDFLGGATLSWVLGLVALLWAADHFLALGIALFGLRRPLEGLRVRRGARGYKRHFDLHRAAGLWLWPITLTLAVSGVYFNWHKEFVTALNLVSPVTPDFQDRKNRPLPSGPALSFPAAYNRFSAIASPEKITSFSFNDDVSAWRARMHDPRDLSPNGMRIVWLAADGRVLEDRHETEGTFADKALAWMFPLHSGMAFGTVGRIIIATTGIGIASMIVTGVLLWRRKRVARLTHARRRRERLSVVDRDGNTADHWRSASALEL